MFTEPEVWPEVLLGQQRRSKSDQNKFAILFYSFQVLSTILLLTQKIIYTSVFLTFN